MCPKPYKFIGFGDIHGPKPYKFTGFGDIHGPKPYKFIGFGLLMLSPQTIPHPPPSRPQQTPSGGVSNPEGVSHKLHFGRVGEGVGGKG